VKCVVAVEYVTQTEERAALTHAYGVAIDQKGTIILPAAAVDRAPPRTR
jgi:hypothetical protein